MFFCSDSMKRQAESTKQWKKCTTNFKSKKCSGLRTSPFTKDLKVFYMGPPDIQLKHQGEKHRLGVSIACHGRGSLGVAGGVAIE
jgi:hypothetical protein